MRRCFALKRGTMQNGKQIKNDRNLALKAIRRGTCEELGKPGSRNRLRFKRCGGTLNLDQHHHGSRNRNRRRRMHGNAQRAMVGIRVDRMDVRHLRHGEQSEQN
jgi:hypothetical protein